MINHFTTFVFALCCFLLTACSGGSDTPHAANPVADHGDTMVSNIAGKVFTNARVYTVNEDQPWAEAVAIKDNRIVYVGDSPGMI